MTHASAAPHTLADHLLDVLHLFADFFEFGFGFDDGLGNGGSVGLGADGIEFAENFLTEEIEGAARGIGCVQVFAESGAMGIQAGKFLGDVAAICEQRQLFKDPLIRQVQFEAGLTQTFQQKFALTRRTLLGSVGQELPQFAERVEAGLNVGQQIGAFAAAHAGELSEGFVEGRLDGVPSGFGIYFA